LSTFTFNEVLKNGNTYTFIEVKFNPCSVLLLRYKLRFICYNVRYKNCALIPRRLQNALGWPLYSG